MNIFILSIFVMLLVSQATSLNSIPIEFVEPTAYWRTYFAGLFQNNEPVSKTEFQNKLSDYARDSLTVNFHSSLNNFNFILFYPRELKTRKWLST